jgi:predicted HTH transcriptional regulator
MRPDIEKQTFNIMKELCAFLNHKGGILYLGVNDQGGGQGLEEDMKYEYFRDSRDKYDNYVRNQIVAQLGQEASHCIE